MRNTTGMEDLNRVCTYCGSKGFVSTGVKCSISLKSKLLQNFLYSFLHICVKKKKEKKITGRKGLFSGLHCRGKQWKLCVIYYIKMLLHPTGLMATTFTGKEAKISSRKAFLSNFCGGCIIFHMQYMTTCAEHQQFARAVFIFRLFFAKPGCLTPKGKASL